jgi:hypothetical protein
LGKVTADGRVVPVDDNSKGEADDDYNYDKLLDVWVTINVAPLPPGLVVKRHGGVTPVIALLLQEHVERKSRRVILGVFDRHLGITDDTGNVVPVEGRSPDLDLGPWAVSEI